MEVKYPVIYDLQIMGFYLGGSRRMAQLHPNQVKVNLTADWDFYCDDTVENHVILLELQFQPKAKLGLRDSECVDIYCHPKWPVQAVVRKDAEFYKRCFESIPVTDFLEIIWKGSPSRTKSYNKEEVVKYFNALYERKKGSEK